MGLAGWAYHVVKGLVSDKNGDDVVSRQKSPTPTKAARIAYLGRLDNPALNEAALAVLASKAANGLLVLLPDIPQAKDFAARLPENARVRLIPAKASIKGKAALPLALAKRSVLAAKILAGRLDEALGRERERILPSVEATELLVLGVAGSAVDYVICSVPCGKTVLAGNFSQLAPAIRKRISCVANLCKTARGTLPELNPAKLDEKTRKAYYNDYLQMNLVTRHTPNTENSCVMSGLAALHAPAESSPSDFSIVLDNQQALGVTTGNSRIIVGTLRPIVKWGTASLVRYRIEVPKSLGPSLPDHTGVLLRYTPTAISENVELEGTTQIYCNIINRHQGERKRWKALLDEQANTALFFHHGPQNRLIVGARHINPTDYPKGKLKVELAWWLAKARPYKDAVVLYEKNASRYEESASVTYEALLDAGHDNVRFILDDSYPQKGAIPKRYQRNIVSKNSLEHYRLFFSAKTFIGTEMLVHCIELGSSSRRIGDRLKDPRLNYIFLQHGVMYMVSLDSAGRSYFGPRKTTTGKHRVVVSSELEKRHFIERARYPEGRLYVCGLPKFDRCRWNPHADRVVVMPTWRPWELNAARSDFLNTGYYRFLERIASCVPDDLHDKLTILAHPLFQQFVGDEDNPLKRFIPSGQTYDDILVNAKVLITDYSSISYDAFYRGANVVFFWPEKDECLKRYGPSTTLMLDEESAFGDVCYTDEELTASVLANYQHPQTDDHVRRYRRIVEFHDGNNTGRLMGLLESDGVI